MIFRPRPCSPIAATGSSARANPSGCSSAEPRPSWSRTAAVPPARPGPAAPAACVDDRDGTPAVLGAHLHFVLLAGPGVKDDVGTGLAERQGDVGARVRRDS